MRGIVQDQTGAVLQGARVSLKDESGRVVRAVVTDAKGEFLVDRLPPGAYVLEGEFEGFRPATVNVRIGTRRLPVQTLVLQLASQTQEITVNAGDDVVTAAAAANRDAIVIDDQALKNLPIFDRDIVGTLARFLDASAMGSGGVTLVVDGMEARKVGGRAVGDSADQGQPGSLRRRIPAAGARPHRGHDQGRHRELQRLDGLHVPRRAPECARSVRGDPSAGTAPDPAKGCSAVRCSTASATTSSSRSDGAQDNLQSIVVAARSGRVDQRGRAAAGPRPGAVGVADAPAGPAPHALVPVHQRGHVNRQPGRRWHHAPGVGRGRPRVTRRRSSWARAAC